VTRSSGGGIFYPTNSALEEIVKKQLALPKGNGATISGIKQAGATRADFEKTLKERITKNLNKSKTKIDRVSSVRVALKKDGTVDYVSVTADSHFWAGDADLIEAIMQGSPYPAIGDWTCIMLTLSPPLSGDKNAFRLDAHYEPDFGSYMENLKDKIKNCWWPRREFNHGKTITTFKVNADGSISELRVLQASGSPYSDRCALKAVQWAAPFDPLPTFAPEQVSIQFTFAQSSNHASHSGQFRRF
jgi:TonB family protein